MNNQSVKIPKQPALKPPEDYYRLRREGIGFIEQMGSKQWTDYNLHDPGITILEALCFAITDLAYRIGWDIKDLLTPAVKSKDSESPFPAQPFFTAREILTINPCTPDDFRRLLIDIDTVRNAWVFCKKCGCDLEYYAWCEENRMNISDTAPGNDLLYPQQIKPLGLYEALLELEADPDLGDLNNRKVEYRYSVFDGDLKLHWITLELRFPDWELEKREEWQMLLNSTDAFEGQNGKSFAINLIKFNRTNDKTDTTVMSDAELRKSWQNLFYISFEIELQPGGEKIIIENATLRIFAGTTARNQTTESSLREILRDTTTNSIIQRYRNKLLRIEQVVTKAKEVLNTHRNLDEDYCRINGVKVEDIAVCADVEVAADADIEWVQAQIWFEITSYLNPPVHFYNLQDLVSKDINVDNIADGSASTINNNEKKSGIPVEEIFNGPELNSGFIKADELEKAGLKSVLRTSDIINRLMDIKGVTAVNNLMLSKYDELGNLVRGAADPTFSASAPPTPIFDANKSSASWLLYVSELHQPRLYFNFSRFLFYKNGLPFLPRMDEALETYKQILGENERPKIKNALTDLPVPSGTFRNPQEYFPVQYSLPRSYGIGTAGLPSHATTLRRTQAKQLKAYLLVFEQILGNAYAQIAHTADLFSMDPSVKKTYFIKEFTDSVIAGYTDLIDGLDASKLGEMRETGTQFQERRNRFLDHILARFGEQFTEYALLLTNFQGERLALSHLIDDKISFLKAYPSISHDRGKAFNYKTPLLPNNIAGLKRRISLLLGYPDISFYWNLASASVIHYQLKDRNNTIWMEGNVTIPATQEAKIGQTVFRIVLVQMIQPESYEIAPQRSHFRLKLKDEDGKSIGQFPKLLRTRAEAKALQDELTNWSSNERAIVVEHLLLRPKFPGDALFDLCIQDACTGCDDDPYSFRLTFVMPGWIEPFNVNMDMRRFANKTIQQETPSHLLPKVCWVGNDGFILNPCDQVVADLAELLEKEGLTSGDISPTPIESCACADTIYATFGEAFQRWYEDKTLDFFHEEALTTALENEFNTQINLADITCAIVLTPGLWANVTKLMVAYFRQITLNGWQFERFEDAWYAWLEANAGFDWTEERLQERIEAILVGNVLLPFAVNGEQRADICMCASSILLSCGTSFYNWMDDNIRAGNRLEDLTPFTPDEVILCSGYTFKEGTKEAIETLLSNRYNAYKEVSYRLRLVINLLNKLRNTYPGATLHDCDDSSDENPVRLGSTALGNYPLRRSSTSPSESPGIGNTRHPPT